jgi:hypothetical protein
MKIKQLLALFCFSLFALSVFAQTKEEKTAEFEWEKIVRLVTKKAEVENYFGKPEKNRILTCSYDTKFGKIFVSYGVEPTHMMYTCNPSSDTVGNFQINLTEARPIEGLGWDLDKFDKFPRNAEIDVYRYYEKGFYFTTVNGQDGKEVVTTISYMPSYTTMENKCINKPRLPKRFHLVSNATKTFVSEAVKNDNFEGFSKLSRADLF